MNNYTPTEGTQTGHFLLYTAASIWAGNDIVGVGVFYRTESGTPYLITARHVWKDDKRRPTRLRWHVTFESDDEAKRDEVSSSGQVNSPLSFIEHQAQWLGIENPRSRFIERPSSCFVEDLGFQPQEDVVALVCHLSPVIAKGTCFIGPEFLIPEEELKMVTLHHRIVMYCIPARDGLPLMRGGHFASAPWENRPRAEYRCGLADMACFPGDSGSPIFRSVVPEHGKAPPLQLLGIHVAGQDPLELYTDLPHDEWLNRESDKIQSAAGRELEDEEISAVLPIGSMSLKALEGLINEKIPQNMGVYVKSHVLAELEKLHQ